MSDSKERVHDSYTCTDPDCGECQRESNIEGIRLHSKLPSSPAGEIASEAEYDTPERMAALVQQAEKECTGKPDDWRDFIAELSQLAPEAAAAPETIALGFKPWRVLNNAPGIIGFRSTDNTGETLELFLRESAAPIAPAAAPDEVIEKLVDALNGVRMWMHVNVPRDVVDSIVNALVRAESYRKESEAKNG